MNEEKTVLVEDIPCGQSVTTVYRDVSGVIVRQDVEITVSADAMILASGRVE